MEILQLKLQYFHFFPLFVYLGMGVAPRILRVISCEFWALLNFIIFCLFFCLLFLFYISFICLLVIILLFPDSKAPGLLVLSVL